MRSGNSGVGGSREPLYREWSLVHPFVHPFDGIGQRRADLMDGRGDLNWPNATRADALDRPARSLKVATLKGDD
jgi:hypothetical protein